MSEQPRQRPARKPTMREALEEHAPWKPAPWEPADASALQALSRGECPPHLQQRALKWIIEQACATYDMHYRPGPEGDRDTTFALGRAFPGQQIVKLLKVRVNKDGEQP